MKMNTTEFHTKQTFTRCHKCASHLLSSRINHCLKHNTMRPDNEPCEDERALHSADIHDMTNAMQKGGAE